MEKLLFSMYARKCMDESASSFFVSRSIHLERVDVERVYGPQCKHRGCEFKSREFSRELAARKV